MDCFYRFFFFGLEGGGGGGVVNFMVDVSAKCSLQLVSYFLFCTVYA